MGGSMAMGDGMTLGPGMGTNAIMLQQQLQAMQKQMLQMQMVQQAMLERMEEMSGRTLNVNGSTRRSSFRTASHRKTSTTKHASRRTKPKSTPSSDESSTVAATERPAQLATRERMKCGGQRGMKFLFGVDRGERQPVE